MRIALGIALAAILSLAGGEFFTSNAAVKKSRKPKRKSTAEIIFEKYPYFRGDKEHNPENLAKQNEIADEHHLPRITDDDLPRKIEEGFLVCVLCPARKEERLADDKRFKVNLPKERSFIAPEALDYVRRVAIAHSETFNRKRYGVLKIGSLLRTEEQQAWMAEEIGRRGHRRKRVANAASGDTPETRSVHTTGYAFDISTRGMRSEETIWLANFLARDMASCLNQDMAGCFAMIVYEPHRADFHVFVVPQDKP